MVQYFKLRYHPLTTLLAALVLGVGLCDSTAPFMSTPAENDESTNACELLVSYCKWVLSDSQLKGEYMTAMQCDWIQLMMMMLAAAWLPEWVAGFAPFLCHPSCWGSGGAHDLGCCMTGMYAHGQEPGQ